MSTTLSSSTSISTGAACAAPQFPSSDVYCGARSNAGLPANVSSVFSDCCNNAPVREFANGCGYFCLSFEQPVNDLSTCLQSNGILPQAVFCNAQATAVATGRPSTTSASSTSRTSGATTGPASSTPTGAASSLVAAQGMSKVGMGLMGMVVVSFFTGVLL